VHKLQPHRGKTHQPRATPWELGHKNILRPERARHVRPQSPRGSWSLPPWLDPVIGLARAGWCPGVLPFQGADGGWAEFPGRCPGLMGGRTVGADGPHARLDPPPPSGPTSAALASLARSDAGVRGAYPNLHLCQGSEESPESGFRRILSCTLLDQPSEQCPAPAGRKRRPP
jgi:hypothetical protein